MKQRFLKLFLLTLLAALCCAHAASASVKIGGLYYNLNSSTKTATVTYKNDNSSSNRDYVYGDWVIPSTVEYDGTIYSVTSISIYAFNGCSGLKSVTIPNSVTSIGKYAFNKCSGMESVTIGNSVTSIGDYAFYKCSGLKSVTIPDSVTSIGRDAFHYCSGLTSVIIGNSVTSIGIYAFCGCSGLKSVTIGNSVTKIGCSAFYGCSGLTSVTSIESNAFEGCSGLTSVTIPNSVTSIGYHTFYGCSGLKSVTIGNSVTSIGDYAFPYSGVIKAIWLTNTPPEGANDVRATINYVSNNRYGFSNQKVYTSLGSKFEVDNVVYVPVSPSERTCDVIDCNYNPTSKTVTIDSVVTNHNVQLKVLNVNDYAFYGNDSITALTAKNNGNIGDYAFSGCNRVNSLTIGGNVTAIGDNAFYNNTGLREVVIPDSVTTVGRLAFAGCSSLNSVTIGKGVNVLSSSLFKNCTSLGNIRIPGNVNEINDSVFAGCWALQDVTFADASGDETPTITLGSNGSSPLFADCTLDDVYIGRKLSYKASSSYGYSPFYSNASLRTVKITDKETEIYEKEFYGCSNLQSFECGDGVTKIGRWAFSGCSALQSYASGTSVESIGAGAFSDCTGLTSFTTLAAVPPVCGTQALDDINKWECTLYVLPGSVDDYKAADQWKEFFFVEEPAGVEDVVVDQITDSVNAPIYDIMGRKVSTTTPGRIYIQNGRKFIAR